MSCEDDQDRNDLGRGKQLEGMIKKGLVIAVLGAAIVAQLYLLSGTVDEIVTAECTVSYFDREKVRAPVDGFVESIVRESDGTVKVTLQSPELWNQIDEQRVAVQRLESRTTLAQTARDADDVQRLARAAATAKDKLNELQADTEKLVIRSAIPGDVSLASLNSLDGQYVTEGEALLTIFNRSQVKALLVVEEEDVARVCAGLPICYTVASIQGVETFEGEVLQVHSEPVVEGARKLYQVDVTINNASRSSIEGTKGTSEVYLGKISLFRHGYNLASQSLKAYFDGGEQRPASAIVELDAIDLESNTLH